MLKMKATGFCSVLLLFFLYHEKNDASLQVLGNTQHYWPFDRHHGIIDVTTNVTGLKYGKVKNVYFEGHRDSFLHTNGRAWVDLGNFTGSCLGEPWRCKGALTVFTWLKYYPHKNKKYFIGTTSHLSHQEGFSIYKKSEKHGGNFTVVTVNDGKTEWSGHFPLKPEIWAHVAFTWDNETGLSLFHNCRPIALVSEGRTITYERNNKSKLLEHHLTLSGGIKSHPHAGTKAAYDDLTVMYREMKQHEWSQICYQKLEPPQITKSCQGSTRHLIVRWTSPRMTYDILEGFVLFTGNSTSRQWTNVAQLGNETSFNFTGLEPGTTYRFRIQNAFRFGVGKTSDTMACKTAKEVLGPPVNLTVEMTSSSAVLIKWNEPVGGAKDVLGYKIKYRALYSDDESRTLNVGPLRTQFLITKLSKNTKYRVQVTSYGDYGFIASQPSEITAKTDANNTKSVTEIYKELLGAQTIRIAWKKPSDKYKVFAYRVFVKWSMPGHEQNMLPLYDGNKTECIYSTRNIPSSLTFDVMAYVVSEIPLIPVRDPPQNVTIVSLAWSFITMNWTSPFQEHIVDFADLYQLTVKSDKDEIFFTTPNTHARIDGLRQLTKYLVNLQAWNGLGFGPFRANDTEIMTLDRNECADGSNMCHMNADCLNTQGSYSCECKPGFIGDGRDCEKEPEGLSEDLFCGKDNLAGVEWQKNLANRQAVMPCPQGTVGLAFRRCTGPPAVWQLPDLSDCVSKWMSDINQQLANPNVSVLSVANQLSNFTDVKSGKPLYAGDLKLLVDVIGVLSRRGLDISNDSSSDDQAKTFIKAVIGTASNIVDNKNLVSWKYMPQHSQADKASSLIDSLDTVALDLANSSRTNQENTDNVVMTVKSLVHITDPWGLVIRQISDQEEVTSSNTVLLPPSVLSGETSGEKPNLATFVSFKTLGALLTPKENNRDQKKNTESMAVNSAVVSLNLRPLSTRTFKEPVVIILRHSVDNKEKKDQPKCAFLDKEKNDSWSEVGCKVNATNTTHTVCHCYHLTSFAVLMSVRQDVSSSISKEHQLALSVITYIGASISIVALCLAFLTFHFFRFSSSGRTFIHKNLAIALIFAQLVFLFGIGKTANRWVCKGIAIALHYLFLVAFSWMALEGVMLYLMLVKVFHTKTAPTKTKKIFFCVGWALPVAIVVTAGVMFHEGYGTPSYCWLSLDRGFIWSFVGPVLLVLVFNFMCLGMTFQVMARKGPASNKKRTNKIRKWSKACMLLTCILGLTWLFGVFYINQESLFMAYFFTTFNTLQGLFIFLFHCIGDDKIRREYHRMLCCVDHDKQYLLSKQSESSSSKSESRPSRNTLDNFKNKNQTITSSASSVGTIESKKNTFIVHVTDGQVQIRGVHPDAVSRDYMSTQRQSQASFTSFGQPANKDRNSIVRHSTASKASEAQESDQEVQLQTEEEVEEHN